MQNLHFISAKCHQSGREQGFQFAPDEIKENYDFKIETKDFSGSRIDFQKGHQICKGYQMLYQHIKNIYSSPESQNDIIITIGGDNSISSATVAAMNEKYMYQQGESVFSNLRVLWIDCFPDIHNFYTSETKNLNEMPVASLIGLTDPSFANHKLLLKPDQIMYFGISDEIDKTMLNDLGIEYYTDKKINQIGSSNILEILMDFFENCPIHVVLDMKVFNKKISNCVDPINEAGLDEKNVINLLSSLKNQIVAMDVTEFNPCLGTNLDVKNTKELIRKCLVETFNIREKSINVFNEHTKFLIYRPSVQESPDDYGWYILRAIPNDVKEGLIKSIGDDEITTIDIEDEEYMVTKTNMEEQNKKSFYTTVNVLDTVLFPNEKISMAFELVNSNKIDNTV